MKTSALFAAALCAGLAVAPAFGGSESDANKQLVKDAVIMLFIDHKVDQAVDTYFAPDYIQHNPLVPTGSAPMRAFFKQFYAGNPTATIEISHVIADGDLVAVHYRTKVSAEDRGAAVVDIFRVANGKIVEHWDVYEPVPEKSANSNGMF
jgi:predicted SnoaL-like aldol condensation-catalyzing enzyme